MGVKEYFRLIIWLALLATSISYDQPELGADGGGNGTPKSGTGNLIPPSANRKGALIAIIVVGVIGVIFIFIGVILCACYRRAKRQRIPEGGTPMAMTSIATPRSSSSIAGESQSNRSSFVTTYEPNIPKKAKKSPLQDNVTSTKVPINITPDDPEFMIREQEYMRCLQSSPTDNSVGYTEHYTPVKGMYISSPTASLVDDTRPASPRRSHCSDMDCNSSDEDYPSATQNMPRNRRIRKRESNENRLNILRRRFHNVLHGKTKEEQLDIIFLTADFCAGIFDHRGGYLEIPDTSVQLYIPPGALPEGVMQEIYIYLNHYDGINGAGNATSPIIRCGPSGLRFQDGIFGVVLSFPSAHNNAPFRVYTKESGGNLNQGWINLTEESADRCFTDGDGTVHLMLNHFSDFKTEKLPEDVQSTKKGLKLSAFGKPFKPKQGSFHLFVCMLKPSDQKKVDGEAARLGYYPLQDGNTLININDGDDVKLTLTDLKNRWQLLYPDELNQTLHALTDYHIICRCDFDIEYKSDSTDHTGGLHFRIIGRTDSQVVKLPIHVSEGWMCSSIAFSSDESTKSDLACSWLESKSEDLQQNESRFGTTIFGRINPKVSNHLSAQAYYELCVELNTQRYPPTDWRLLMAELGLGEMRYIHEIEQGREAGAVVVINLFFSQNKGKEALEMLHAACRKVRLNRAVQIIERDQPQLRLDNTSLASLQDVHGDVCEKPSDDNNNQTSLLPDVTQQAAANSLCHMMSQVMIREPSLLPSQPKKQGQHGQGLSIEGLNATSETQEIFIDELQTQVQYGNKDMFPHQTFI